MDYEQLMANRLKSALHKQEMRGNLLTKSTSIYCLILIILDLFNLWNECIEKEKILKFA